MPRFQFSLRTVLVVMTVLAVPLSWWSWKAERQRKAVAALRKNGAFVVYNITNNPTTAHVPRTQGYPPFLHWRYKPIQVYLYQLPSDGDLAALQALDGLETVFTYTVLNEDDLRRLESAIPKSRVEVSLFNSWPP